MDTPQATPSDTIAGVSTAPGEGAIGIVRVSGGGALRILKKIFHPAGVRDQSPFTSHRLYYGHVSDGRDGMLDEVLAVYMRGPRTYTREDVVEIHCHGGVAAVREVLRAVLSQGARPAQPGEFTMRAFLNGRIDLTRAEAVMDIIQARTQKSLLHASAQLGGRLGEKIVRLRERLLSLTAHLEAYIDFPDEDIPAAEMEGFKTRAGDLLRETRNLVASYEQGRIIREGAAVAIVGRPNVGKSSLLNLLLDEERAIVTELPGTTRDTIEECVSVDGVPIRLIDTAGIRDSRDIAESEGVRRSRQAMEHAELVLLVLDSSEPLHASDSALLESVGSGKCLIVLNKKDLPAAWPPAEVADETAVEISCRLGSGISSLRSAIFKRLMGSPTSTEDVMITRLRHRDSLELAAAGLAEFIEGINKGEEPEILALSLREAMEGLDQILGVTTPDDVLELVFRDFCIGK